MHFLRSSADDSQVSGLSLSLSSTVSLHPLYQFYFFASCIYLLIGIWNYTANTLIRSVFDTLSIGSSRVAVVLICRKRDANFSLGAPRYHFSNSLIKPMQPSAPLFAAAAAIIICISTSASFIVVVSAAKECNSYTPLPSGVTTYEVDDGGCYFCATQSHAYETLGFHPDNGDEESDNKKNSAIPLSGDELSNHCATLCNADPKCIAYTIARPVVLEADLYMWDKTANCCLDRMEAPNELYVDANVIDPDHDELSECQLGAMCWTRFEREVGGCSDEELHGVPDGSDQCTMVW